MNWHARTVEEIAAELGVDPSAGLDPAEARRRLAEVGPNRLEAERSVGPWTLLARQFSDILIWVLIAAAFVSGVLIGDLVDAVVILAIVVLNSVIGFVQESRAETALQHLQEMAAPDAVVRRGGETMRVKAEEVVPGDLVVLSGGDRVPADARVVEAIGLEADEASLTGESLPVSKSARPAGADAGVADRTSMVHAGTSVAGGRGTAMVVATGGGTEMGSIARMLEEDRPETPLQVELDRIGRRIALLAGAAAVLVFGLGLTRGIEVESLLLIAVALAVAAIPEGLPAVATITLARGVRAMAERSAIVRRLPAVEALGAASVICTDKTGTLTRNEMRVQVLMGSGGEMDRDSHDPAVVRCAEISLLCSDVQVSQDEPAGDATEMALFEAASRVLDRQRLLDERPRVDEVPFDSERKRMSTLHRAGNGTFFMAVKGAPEVVLERATLEEGADGPVPVDDDRRRRLATTAEELAARGLRTLALAYRELDEAPASLEDEERDLIIAGIVGISDEVRPEASGAVAMARGAGITVVMVTGDHAVTARAVAEDLGLLEGRRVVGGRELRSVSAEDLEPQIEEIGVFARVDPADKVSIVKAWQARGGIVAMTGDGINDAPALRIADIGIAMGSGTAVAKESSAMILADDNFATIVTAVERGREIFSNLKKVVYFLLAANISEVVVMLAGFLLFGGFGEPLLAVQLLWINLVTDGLPALALGVDSPSADVMRMPPDADRDILGVFHQLRLLWQGALIAAGPIGLFAYGALIRELPWDQVRTMAFTAVVFGQLLFALVVRAQTRSVWRSRPGRNRWLVASLLASIALQLMVVLTPVGEALFDVVLFPALDWPAVIAAAVVPFLLIDAVKSAIRKRRPDLVTAFD